MSRLDYFNKEWVRVAGTVTKAEKLLKEVANVQNPTVGWARTHGCKAVKLQGPGNRSQPDYLFAIPGGTPFLIEFKRPGEVPTILQTNTILGWLKDGYDVQVHDTKESAIEELKLRLRP
jgi:hypothetical protein